MKFSATSFAAAAVLSASLVAAPAFAGGWALSGDESKVAFGSVKKDTVGEVHHFGNLSGSVADDGTATVEIDVTSVETWIDIRNERIQKMVFDAVSFPLATISAKIDMDEVNGLKPGETASVTSEATVSLVGQDIPVEADLFVVALSDQKVMVTTDEMIMLSTADLGIDGGVDQLMEVAKLPSITRVTPVTLRLVFEKQ
ncbi:MAG: YceI family protein [Pseudomonadota bacterium]